MSIFQAIILGITQGLTEFLPVSSSGHLLIIPTLLGWEPHTLVFDTTLHLGTSLALIVYFFNDLKAIVAAVFRDTLGIFSTKKKEKLERGFSKDAVLGFKLALGSIPAVVLGFLLNDYFETTFRAIGWTALSLLLGSVLMFFAEYLYKDGGKKNTNGDAGLENISWVKSVLIGLFQSLALFPGFSRSGSTLSGGMFLGLPKEDAAKFSFLLSIPIILGAGIYQLVSAPMIGVELASLIAGLIFSFLSGSVAIRFLLEFLKSNKLYVFVVYRVLVALMLVLLFVS